MAEDDVTSVCELLDRIDVAAEHNEQTSIENMLHEVGDVLGAGPAAGRAHHGAPVIGDIPAFGAWLRPVAGLLDSWSKPRLSALTRGGGYFARSSRRVVCNICDRHSKADVAVPGQEW